MGYASISWHTLMHLGESASPLDANKTQKHTCQTPLNLLCLYQALLELSFKKKTRSQTNIYTSRKRKLTLGWKCIFSSVRDTFKFNDVIKTVKIHYFLFCMYKTVLNRLNLNYFSVLSDFHKKNSWVLAHNPLDLRAGMCPPPMTSLILCVTNIFDGWFWSQKKRK